jgi:hypothetical protein
MNYLSVLTNLWYESHTILIISEISWNNEILDYPESNHEVMNESSEFKMIDWLEYEIHNRCRNILIFEKYKETKRS